MCVCVLFGCVRVCVCVHKCVCVRVCVRKRVRVCVCVRARAREHGPRVRAFVVRQNRVADGGLGVGGGGQCQVGGGGQCQVSHSWLSPFRHF